MYSLIGRYLFLQIRKVVIWRYGFWNHFHINVFFLYLLFPWIVFCDFWILSSQQKLLQFVCVCVWYVVINCRKVCIVWHLAALKVSRIKGSYLNWNLKIFFFSVLENLEYSALKILFWSSWLILFLLPKSMSFKGLDVSICS